MRQLRLALGKDQDRVARVILTDKSARTDQKLQQLLTGEYQGIYHWQANDKTLAIGLNGQLPSSNAATLEGFYIVDPHGNLILNYDGNRDVGVVLQDLERLLKVSQIG